MGKSWFLTLGFAALGVVLMFIRRSPPVAADKIAAEATISFKDKDGNPVLHGSPYNFREGETYTATISVKNTSTLEELPAAAEMEISLYAASDIKTYMPKSTWRYTFAAGETKNFSQVLVSQVSDAPDSGTVTAMVDTLEGERVATGSNEFNINEIPQIVYSAMIVFI